jgi:DNA-binding transcriptional LysR family regulator
MSAPLADLHLLTVLAQTRSFTQAAKRLGVSKASVSQRVAALEQAAGLPLVRRSTRSVALTEAGLRLVEETQAPFARIEQAFGAVRDSAGAVRGLVRLSAPVALGRQCIAPVLPGFLAAHPEVRVEMALSDRLVNLVHDGFDLAVRHSSHVPDSHVAWRLADCRSRLVASPGWTGREGALTAPADLATRACLLYLREGGVPTWHFERRVGRRTERFSVPVAGRFKADNSEVLREAALQGLGVALLPDFSADVHLAQGDLVELLPEWTPVGFFGDAVHLIRPYGPQVPRAVSALVAHLRQVLAGGFAATAPAGRRATTPTPAGPPPSTPRPAARGRGRAPSRA